MTDETEIDGEHGHEHEHDGPAPCLLCYLWAAIEQYHDDSGRIDPTTGEQIWETQFIIVHLMDVVAQFIAAHPPQDHRRIMTEVAKYLGRTVPEFHDSGTHPRLGPSRKH